MSEIVIYQNKESNLNLKLTISKFLIVQQERSRKVQRGLGIVKTQMSSYLIKELGL